MGRGAHTAVVDAKAPPWGERERILMINTAATVIQFPTPEDGSIRDPDPKRRNSRLRSAGVGIKREGRFDYRILRRDSGEQLGRARTLRGADYVAHRFADPRDRKAA